MLFDMKSTKEYTQNVDLLVQMDTDVPHKTAMKNQMKYHMSATREDSIFLDVQDLCRDLVHSNDVENFQAKQQWKVVAVDCGPRVSFDLHNFYKQKQF
jgi:hypothetical protein